VAPIVTFDSGNAAEAGGEPQAFDLTLPVGVDGLIVRSEHGASAGAVSLQPLGISRDGERARQSAGFAAAFGDVTVYFTSDGVFPEATGFWVRAGVDATVVIAHPNAGAPLEVRLRNAPIANQVSLETGVWRQSADLEPGAERLVTLPPPGSSRVTVLHIRAERGVRPADRDPANRDMRRLGVWIEIVRT
jgi:hypothetical protein